MLHLSWTTTTKRDKLSAFVLDKSTLEMLINSNNVATGENHADHLCYLQCVLLHVLGAVMADVMLGGPGTGSSLSLVTAGNKESSL